MAGKFASAKPARVKSVAVVAAAAVVVDMAGAAEAEAEAVAARGVRIVGVVVIEFQI